jgi:phenylpropionate dioxygenase-like ring-hydroxylating dioxygenase large terminal subunit
MGAAIDWTAQAIRDLVRADRVDRRVYTDPDLFELEMARIYGRAWLFLGHESQLRREGDFFTTRHGNRPVIVTRDGEGRIRVFLNRCAHRGAMVCRLESGNARRFRCPYHGWTYDGAGVLLGIPARRAYGEGFDAADPRLGLASLPRVASYRGFIFASAAAEGPDLPAFLGRLASSLDDLVDRAPEGEVEFAGSVLRHRFDGNWKLQMENLNDLQHPMFVHASSIDAARPAAEREREFDDDDIMAANGASLSELDRMGVSTYARGHSFMGGLPVPHTFGDAAMAEYRARLEARHGAARTREILAVDRHISLVYPNLAVQGFFQQIKVVHPVAVDRTDLCVYVFRLKGAPPEFYRAAVRFVTSVNSPASLILGDDLEVFERTQRGLSAGATSRADGAGNDAARWVIFASGLGREAADSHGGFRSPGLSEAPMRNQFRAWCDYMTVA